MDTVTDPDAAARLARRYPRKHRRTAWVPVALLLAVVGTLWLVWAGGYGATRTVTARVDAYEVRSDTLIVVTVSVDRPDPTKAAECRLYAQAASYDRVGEAPVGVDSGGEALTTVQFELRTFKRATTAAVEACRVIG